MAGKLVDLQSAKEFVGITTNNYDVLIDFLLKSISSTIIRFMGVKNLEYGNVKDVFYPTYGEYKTVFMLSKYPVDLSQPFTVYKTGFDETVKTEVDNTKYYVIADQGTLIFSSPDDIITSKMIEVDYTAGYKLDSNNVYIDIPDGLRFACLLWFSTIWNTRELRGVERVDNAVRQSIQMTTQTIPDDVKQIIFQYQRNSF